MVRKKASNGAYEITNVVRDKKGRITYLQINHDQVYHYTDLASIARTNSFYSFYVLKDGVKTKARLVSPKDGGSDYFTTDPNKDKMDNLDYLPLAVL